VSERTKIQRRYGGFCFCCSDSHPAFVFRSDLNYRNELEFSEVLQLVNLKEWRVLCGYDQLLAQMSKQLVFCGFQEALVRFAPTYRWERKENQFSNKKFQSPSWTDRVLWHSLTGLADLKLQTYSSAPNLMGSDHRPVFACFDLKIRPWYTGKLPKSTPSIPVRISHNSGVSAASLATAAAAAAAPAPEKKLEKRDSKDAPNSPSNAAGSKLPPPLPPAVPATAAPSAPPPLPVDSDSNGATSGAPPARIAGSMVVTSPKAARLLEIPHGSTVDHSASICIPHAAGHQQHGEGAAKAVYHHYPSLPVALSPLQQAAGGGGGGGGAGATRNASASVSGSSAGGTDPAVAKLGFTPFFFTPEPNGPLWIPPAPRPEHVAATSPLIGSTKEFQIVLSGLKVTFSTPPRGDMALTASAPFLSAWPTTSTVSYQLGLLVGGHHWDEVVLTPFIHDLYYLYTRHILLIISVPSVASSASSSQMNVDQTGAGSQIGTASVALGTICAKIFDQVAQLKPTVVPPKGGGAAASVGGLHSGPQFNPFKPNGPAPGSPGSAPPGSTLKYVNPNSPGFSGDHGEYTFCEPIYREGLYSGQIEGKVCFRYAAPKQ
jgi:hypothetical protein